MIKMFPILMDNVGMQRQCRISRCFRKEVDKTSLFVFVVEVCLCRLMRKMFPILMDNVCVCAWKGNVACVCSVHCCSTVQPRVRWNSLAWWWRRASCCAKGVGFLQQRASSRMSAFSVHAGNGPTWFLLQVSMDLPFERHWPPNLPNR